MSTPFAGALSLCNLASVGIFGIVLSAAFCELEWTRQRKLLLAGCTVLMLALQGVVSLRWSTSFARYLYPVITHLPLVILLVAMTRKVLWSLIAVLTAYLCCQLRRWAALLVFVLQTTQEQKLRSQLEQTQNSLNLQVAQAVREIDALRESQRKASTYRHDLRHHLQYISACIENGRAEAAQEYIHSVCAEIEASKVNVYCENEAANLILSAFATRAQNSGIDFRVHAAIPLVLPLPDSDLCVLLSNALLWRPPPTKRTADCFYRSQTPAASRCSSVPRASPPPASPATALACAASAPLWSSMAACTAFRSSRTSLYCASLCKRSIQCILWATRANCTSRHCFCAIVSSDGSTAA